MVSSNGGIPSWGAFSFCISPNYGRTTSECVLSRLVLGNLKPISATDTYVEPYSIRSEHVDGIPEMEARWLIVSI